MKTVKVSSNDKIVRQLSVAINEAQSAIDLFVELYELKGWFIKIRFCNEVIMEKRNATLKIYY